jgi:hypothetical protein
MKLQSIGTDDFAHAVDRLDSAIRWRRADFSVFFGSWTSAAHPPLASPSPSELVDEDFRRHLSQDIGLSAGILERYSDLIRAFLQKQVGLEGPCWSKLSAADILDFFQRCTRRRSPQYMQRLRTALRSFLR